MDEYEIHQAKLKIITAADWWARDVMRSDRTLSVVEQRLFDAVTHYQRVEKSSFEIPVNLPRPPSLPKEFCFESEIPTQRYSDIPTINSPSFGMPVAKFQVEDILNELDEFDKDGI